MSDLDSGAEEVTSESEDPGQRQETGQNAVDVEGGGHRVQRATVLAERHVALHAAERTEQAHHLGDGGEAFQAHVDMEAKTCLN